MNDRRVQAQVKPTPLGDKKLSDVTVRELSRVLLNLIGAYLCLPFLGLFALLLASGQGLILLGIFGGVAALAYAFIRNASSRSYRRRHFQLVSPRT